MSRRTLLVALLSVLASGGALAQQLAGTAVGDRLGRTLPAPDVANRRDAWGRTLLYEAAERGHANLVEVMLARGADPNARAEYGWTPLHAAAAKGRTAVVELLLARGADVNAQDAWGQRPLHLAYLKKHWPAVRLIQSYGGKS